MKTVLLIDEDQGFRRLVIKALEPDGWNVVEADDGEAGIELAKIHGPRVVVCSALAPRMNGFQVCRTLREDREMADVHVIVTSPRDYAEDRLQASEAGAARFLAKPIHFDELRLLLAQIGGPRPGEQETTQFTRPTMLSAGEATRLRFWGVRGSIPSPGPDTIRYGGNTSCIEVRADGELIILDAGSGIRPCGLNLMKEFKGRPMDITILITHTHWDHIQGFPFFVPAYVPNNNLRIFGYEGARHGLQDTLSGQMESPYFPIGMKQMPGNISIHEQRDLSFNVGKVRVQAAYVNHPGICVGYRIFARDGSITYIPDNEQFLRLKTATATSAAEQQQLEYARKQDNRMVEFIKDSDVLIVDAQYDEKEYATHVGWGHSCVDDSVMLGIRAGVKRCYLFHHDPSHDDARLDEMVAHARKVVADAGSSMVVEGAREGVEFSIGQGAPAPVPRKKPRAVKTA